MLNQKKEINNTDKTRNRENKHQNTIHKTRQQTLNYNLHQITYTPTEKTRSYGERIETHS